MKNFLMVLVTVGFVMASATGCDQGPSAEPGLEGAPRALEFQDGARKFKDMQQTCPVCGKKPIKQEYHSEVKGMRIYFDTRECADQFEENPSQHLEQWEKRGRQRMQEQMGPKTYREAEQQGSQ